MQSAAKCAASGKAAVEAGNYGAASKSYGEAAIACEKSLVGLLCIQANALISAESYAEAKKVAESCLRIAPKNSLSWYWKGMALFKLNFNDQAKKAFDKAVLYEKDLTKKTAYMDWSSRCEEDVETIDATASANGRGFDASIGGAARTRPVELNSTPSATVSKEADEQTEKPVEAPKNNTRMQWYQSSTHVNVDIYAKNVDKAKSSVKFDESHLDISLIRPDTEEFRFEKDVFDAIVPASSAWNVSPYKVEIRMKKANPGNTWRALDRDAEIVSPVVQAGVESKRRSDQRENRQRDWNSIVEKELDGYKEDDSTMSLFRSIYKDADEDMRRAMMKSYSESGGQVLSTNWDEVSKEKVTYKERDN